MIKSNLEGFDPKMSEIYHNILKFKQGEVFNKSIITLKQNISKEDILSIDHQEQFIEEMLCQKLAQYLIKISNTEKENNEDGTVTFTKKMIALNMGEFKHIIDYVIKTLSDEQISEIRKI